MPEKKVYTERALIVQDLFQHKGYAVLLEELTSIQKSAYSYLEDSPDMSGVQRGRGMLEVIRSIDKRLQAISQEVVK